MKSFDSIMRISTILNGFFKGDLSTFQDVVDQAISIRDFYFFKKFYLYLTKVNNSKKETSRLRNMLRNPDDTLSSNAHRLISIIDSIDKEEKVDFFVNLTDSYLNGDVDDIWFFRIANAIEKTTYEDLCNLKNVKLNEENCGYDFLDELYRNGLLCSSGINSNRSIYQQGYYISVLGCLTDLYAVSYHNGERSNELANYIKTQMNNETALTPGIESEKMTSEEMLNILNS